ncbi:MULTISPECIES: cytochrome c [Alphaproteobacteria]|uniref:cytochrome c n=1 Tax=Alphaproteobacteria TaxID=28211 RepID=UPI003263AEAE
MDLSKIIVVAVVIGGLGLVVTRWINAPGTASDPGGAQAAHEPTDLSPLASKGKVLFEANCAACHGQGGVGTDQGPPFINDIYNPGHHPDEAFLVAAKKGVRSHHWNFGDMPPVEGVSDDDLRAIVKYVREMQQANGIKYRPHVM